MAKLTSKAQAKEKPKAEKKAKANGKKSSKAAAKSIDLEDDVTDEEEIEDEDFADNSGDRDGKENHVPSSSSLLADSLKHFGSKDLYSILNIDKTNTNESEIKKAYYKLSLKYHPDKGDESKRDENTAKFQVLSKIYSILSDSEKKKLYDEQGVVDDESGELETRDWQEYWRTLFKKVTKADVDKFYAEYRNSAEERADLLRLYEKHAGDMDRILEEVFSADLVEDEPRFRSIIQEAVDKGEAVAHKKFVGESKQKAARRKATYEKEAEEAAVERVKMGIDESEESLKKAILGRRKTQNDDFLSKLEKKYAKVEKNGKHKAISDDEQSDNDGDLKPKKARTTKTETNKKAKTANAKKVKRL